MIKEEILKLGSVEFERPVAAHIVRKAVLRYRTNVIMTDSKLRSAVGVSDDSSDRNADFVKVSRVADNTYSVSVNVVIRFGISISRVANEIIASVRKDLKDYMNFEPQEVIVHVVGVKAKSKPVIKRNIVIKG